MSNKNKFEISKIIFDVITIILGVAMLIFLATPFVESSVSGITSSVSETASGYSLISFGDGANVGVAVVLLLLVIFTCLTLVSTIIEIFCDFGVIKNEKVDRIASYASVVLSLCVAVLAIVNMITVSTSVSSGSIAFWSAGTYAEWATLSVVLIVGVAMLVTGLLSIEKPKKK